MVNNQKHTITFALMKNLVCFLLVMNLFSVNDSHAFSGLLTVFDPPDESTYNELMADGLDAFYQTDWQQALQYFESMKQMDPEDPRGYFFASMIPFWEYFFIGQNSEAADRFLEESEIAINLGENKLERTPSDTMLIAMLSGLYGYQSLVASGENNIRTALSTGRIGFGYTKKLLEFDDDLPEANIGRGIYHYMVGSVPGALKWLVRLFGLNGDVDTGFDELKRAAESDSYVRTDAKMILAYLYNKEENYNQAVFYLSELNNQFNNNVIFKYVYAETLEKKGDYKSALIQYEKIIDIENPHLEKLTEISRDKKQLLLNGRILSQN